MEAVFSLIVFVNPYTCQFPFLDFQESRGTEIKVQAPTHGESYSLGPSQK